MGMGMGSETETLLTLKYWKKGKSYEININSKQPFKIEGIY